jgi:GH18 family chitinase
MNCSALRLLRREKAQIASYRLNWRIWKISPLHDFTHLFWEQLKQLGFAFREDVTDEEIEGLLNVSEPILAILNRIQQRKVHSKVIKVWL